MKNLGFYIFLLGLLACSTDDGNIDDLFFSTIVPDRMITVGFDSIFERTNFVTEAGTNLVFTYTHQYPQSTMIEDDELGEQLTFEIDSEVDSFEYTDEELRQAKCHYNKIGAWVNSSFQYEVTEGTLTGQKVSENAWDCTFSVLAHPGRIDGEMDNIIEFSGRFSY